MKRPFLFASVAALILALFPLASWAEENLFLRIAGNGNSQLLNATADGTLLWSNVVLNSTGRIQCTTSLVPPKADWRNLLFFHATSPVMSVTVPLKIPPRGMVLIPAGPFMMGHATNALPNTEGYGDELPQHPVYTSAFYLDQNHVTKSLWDEIRLWGLTNGYPDLPIGSWENGTNFSKGSNHPVHLVNWFACVKWCNARSEREGLTPVYYSNPALTAVYRTNELAPYVLWSANGYRLPTEAEWEKAARGDAASRRFPWNDSNEIQHTRANYYSQTNFAYDTSSTRGYHPLFAVGPQPFTSPVGIFPPNAYGLYDMAGNVSDWCWDWYSGTYYSTSPPADPRGPATGASRIIRGGNWYRSADRARVAYRGINTPYIGTDTIGFRCARGL